jgi:RNA polymerase sigma-70 factor (ECF subfamily)
MSMRLFRQESIDQTTYITFISDYKTAMYRIAFGYLGDETKAVDAVDEAVYLGYLHRKELREPKFLKTWLTRILINECYRILKKHKREILTETLPERVSGAEDRYAALSLAVTELPEELRKIIALRYFGGYTIAETAELLKIPEGTVATRTRKALDILRIELDDQEGGESDERATKTATGRTNEALECISGEGL